MPPANHKAYPLLEDSSLDPLQTPDRDDGCPCDESRETDLDVQSESPENEPDPPPKGDPPPLVTPWIHSGWAAQRNRIWKALLETDDAVSWRKCERFAMCGSGHWLYVSKEPPTRYTVATTRCNSRWCLPCSQRRSRILATNVATAMAHGEVRLITLTLKTTTDPLKDCVDRLYRSAKLLRKTDQWQHHVTAALAFCEVTRTADATGWHAHLHVIAKGKFWPQSDLAATWRTITGDSYIVDVRLIRNPRIAASYVTKYTTKPIGGAAATDHELLCEAIRALHGRRLCMALGDWRTLRLTASPSPAEWEQVCEITAEKLQEWTEHRDEIQRTQAAAIKAALAGTGPRVWEVPDPIPKAYLPPPKQTIFDTEPKP